MTLLEGMLTIIIDITIELVFLLVHPVYKNIQLKNVNFIEC